MNEMSLSDRATHTHRPADHPQVRSGSVGVLIVNLGTPDATDAKSVRRYLREFLHDKRVIEEDTITWKFVLNAIILPMRPRRKGLDYAKIWNREKDESPFKTITRSQAEKLSAAPAWRRWWRRDAIGFWWCRFIRNTPPPPARPCVTKCFAPL